MTIKVVLAELKSLGNEKMKAVHVKSGASPYKVFGVKTGDIRTLAKKVKSNHALALELWQTENLDARLLSLLIINPKQLTVKELDGMAKSLDASWVADWFNSNIVKDHADKEKLGEMWLDSDNKWAARSGWSLLAGKIAKGGDDVNPEKILDRIEKEMPKAQPEIQWTMNTALAYVGIYFPGHRERALGIGHKLGIYKDYPVSKGCTSPFAPIWINEMVSRQSKG